MNAEIIKALLAKYLALGVSREFFLSALGLFIILFGKDFGLPVEDPISKLAVALISGMAVVGVLGKKWLDMQKPAEKPAAPAGPSMDNTEDEIIKWEPPK